MDFTIRETKIPGYLEILPVLRSDPRGSFVKTFHAAAFATLRLTTQFAEEYYSISKCGVLRGMHFQTPPAEHTKMVYCVLGRVRDVVVDLRVESPTFGQYEIIDLNAELANMLYIPAGLAHGFYVGSETAILLYKVTSVYSPQNDKGILWSSLGIPWPAPDPLVSERDRQFPAFQDFQSPFVYDGAIRHG